MTNEPGLGKLHIMKGFSLTVSRIASLNIILWTELEYLFPCVQKFKFWRDEKGPLRTKGKSNRECTAVLIVSGWQPVLQTSECILMEEKRRQCHAAVWVAFWDGEQTSLRNSWPTSDSWAITSDRTLSYFSLEPRFKGVTSIDRPMPRAATVLLYCITHYVAIGTYLLCNCTLDLHVEVLVGSARNEGKP